MSRVHRDFHLHLHLNESAAFWTQPQNHGLALLALTIHILEAADAEPVPTNLRSIGEALGRRPILYTNQHGETFEIALWGATERFVDNFWAGQHVEKGGWSLTALEGYARETCARAWMKLNKDSDIGKIGSNFWGDAWIRQLTALGMQWID